LTARLLITALGAALLAFGASHLLALPQLLEGVMRFALAPALAAGGVAHALRPTSPEREGRPFAEAVLHRGFLLLAGWFFYDYLSKTGEFFTFWLAIIVFAGMALALGGLIGLVVRRYWRPAP